MKASISEAQKYFNQLKCAGYDDITMIGHSKGGAEAVANAVATGANAIVFNPATTFLGSYGLSAKNYSGSMNVFVVKGEALNMAEGWFSKPIDSFEWLPAKNTSSWWQIWNHPTNSVKNHYMDTVIWGLKEKGYK